MIVVAHFLKINYELKAICHPGLDQQSSLKPSVIAGLTRNPLENRRGSRVKRGMRMSSAGRHYTNPQKVCQSLKMRQNDRKRLK